MASESGKKDQPASQNDTGVKRRGLLRFGTLVTALTGASAFSVISANSAQAASGDKSPPNSYVPVSEKGAPSGVATLDAASKIPPSQLPDLSATYGRKAVFDVRDYGAKGDGVTDDQPAIQAAITAAGIAGRGTVFVPEGRFVCFTPISIPSNVTIEGASLRSVLYFSWTTSAGGSVFIKNNSQTTGNSDISLRRFSIESAYTGGPFGQGPQGPRRVF
ncbi:hypothetical protein FCN77_20085 [Arthrobacter sp. 24S4-2]|uniref:glycosyl hydrolase family 28-related protein n=1 Tax=Arthrobacter sp. 24S4-2 TaxID=2575374 RepID=UPI0010C77631|nr:hypothetical protein FCN77_20085 [Arthrobacter sp. 24S4-2]